MSEDAVAALDDLEVGVPVRRLAGGRPVCLVRTDGQTVRAVADSCSHEEFALSEGWVYGDRIECVLHGSLFDLRTGEPDGPPAVDPVAVYRCRVVDGTVMVDTSAPAEHG